MIILREQNSEGGGAATLPEVKMKEFSSQEIPNEVLSRDFSLEDFDVEQLSEQSSKEEEVEEKPVKVEQKKDDKSAVKVEEEKQEQEIEQEEEQQEEVKKEERKSVLKPPTTDKKLAQDKQEVKSKQQAIAPPAKDYTGLTDEETKAGKNMSVEAFKIFKKAIEDRKALAKQKDSIYLQHPEAYSLNPEYREIRINQTRASQEAQYWESQLEAIDRGEQLVPFKGWDAKTGQPVFGNPMQPTKMLEERVRQNIMMCNQEARRLAGEVQTYPARYRESLNKDLNDIESYRKEQFSWVGDESLMDHTLDIPGLGERSLKQVREDVNNMIPSYMRGHPLANVLGDTVIAIQILRAEKAQLEQELNINQKQKKEQELVEPSSNGKGNNNGKKKLDKVHGVAEFRVDPELGI